MLFLYWFRYPEIRWNRAKLLFVGIMFLSGIVLEAYVNPILPLYTDDRQSSNGDESRAYLCMLEPEKTSKNEAPKRTST